MNTAAKRVISPFLKAFLNGSTPVPVRFSQTLSNEVNQTIPHHQKPWDLRVAVCLERKPVVVRPKSELEEKYASLQEVLEVEHSVLSDLEVKINQEQVKSKGKKKKKMTDKEEQVILDAERELAKIKEKEDAVEELKKTLSLGTVKTPDDESKNKQSPNRHLDIPLYLLVSSEGRNTYSFPEGTIKKKETLKEAAERILSESYQHASAAQFISNAPAGVVSVKYLPKSSEGESSQGVKVFFYKALLTFDLKQTTETDSAIWLPQDELSGQLSSYYAEKVLRFL